MNVNYLETKLGCLRLVKTGFKTVETNLPFDVQSRCSSAEHPKPKMPKGELAQTNDRLTY